VDRGERLSRIYSFFPWPSDPESEEGKRYFEGALSTMRYVCSRLLEQNMLARDELRVLEICGGAGFGGVALAKALREHGKRAKLLITDLRRDALKTAKRFAMSALGEQVQVRQLDATRLPEVGQTFDVVLLYGLSTPHFCPWDMAKVFAGASEVLEDDGVFLVEEADRVYSIFYLTGYRRTLVETGPDSPTVFMSTHVGYDPKTGFFKRRFIDLKNPENDEVMDVHFWSLAGSLALGWMFFEHVDAMELQAVPGFSVVMRFMCVFAKPRRKIRFWDLRTPKVLEGRK